MSTIKLLLMVHLSAMALLARCQLVVVVDGLKNSNGSVMVGLFDDEKDFLKKAVVGKVAAVEGKVVTVVFKDVKPGKYALSIIHDENGNGKLDTNRIGIPREGFGFGNNAMGIFGPPSFTKASVTIGSERVEQRLRMRYF